MEDVDSLGTSDCGDEIDQVSPDIKAITRELIANGFSDLSGLRFRVRWANLTDEFARAFPCNNGRKGFGGDKGKSYTVAVSVQLKSASREVLMGVIAHELGHVRNQIAKFTSADRQKSLRAFFTTGYALEDGTTCEREADLEAVLAGYGDQLGDCYRHLDDEFGYDSEEDPNGLSPSEIRVARELLSQGFLPNEVSSLVRGASKSS